jgi:hypothetical protein
MIDFLFTIDYEIYGNGTGTLTDLVFEPAQKLKKLFLEWNARFVSFVEVAEFEKIEAWGTDSAIDQVKSQIREFHLDGFEVGLHLHPQWFNARYENRQWVLDYSEYNLCTLPKTRIAAIVDRALAYLRNVTGDPAFTPLSFRAGNWLFQPTQAAASALAAKGIRIDSSVFKGGLQHNYNLDYRSSLKNGYFWPFADNATQPNPQGPWIEVPIHSEMVPFWEMPSSKRLTLNNTFGTTRQSIRRRVNRVRDFLRFKYPLKLDFCRMTLSEMTSIMDRVIEEDRKAPESYRPIVSIGHTKDLNDFETVESFLSFLETNRIPIVTFADIYPRLAPVASEFPCPSARLSPSV